MELCCLRHHSWVVPGPAERLAKLDVRDATEFDRPGWKASLKVGALQTEPGNGKTDERRPPQAVPEFKRKAGIRRNPNTRVCGP